MHTILTTLLIIGAIVALLLILALLMKKGYTTHSEVIINAPVQEVFNYLKHIKNQDNFNKWIMVDPAMKKEYRGVDGTVGFVYGWNGNKEAGEGEQEIKTIVDGQYIETEIRFVRPFAGIAEAKMATESIAGNQTKVIWNTSSNMKYPLNLMLPMIVKMLEKDMAISLGNLKGILER